MEVRELKICRLCLKVVCKNEYEIVGEKLVMVKAILIGLNWAISENPIMCCECSEQLRNSYDFKSTCLITEQHIKTASRGKEDEVDLWQITRDNNHESRENNKICILCLKLNENTMCFDLEEKENVFVMLQKCLPELNLFMVQEPVICQNCYAALESLFNFVVNCLSVEESINTYRNKKGSNSNDRVNLYDVLQFTKIKRESDGGGICAVDFVSGNKFEQVFVKPEDVEGNEFEVKPDSLKSEPMEHEVELENSVKLDDMEIETEAPKRQNSVHTYAMDKRSILQSHILTHDNKDLKSFKCDKCSYSTDHRRDLQCHIFTHRGTKFLVCPECSKDFMGKQRLVAHIFKWHSDKKEMMKLISSKIHYCKLCDYKSVSLTHLQNHIKKLHRKLMCPECRKGFAMKELLDLHILDWHSEKKEVMKLISTKIHYCKSCDFKSVKLTELRTHIKKHHLELACPECWKGFTTKELLDSHILNWHSDKKEVMKLISSKIHYCKSCDYKSVIVTSLQSHVKNLHEASFNRRKMHLDLLLANQHSDEGDTIKSTKPFVCPACSRCFVMKENLDSHILIWHSDKKEVMKLISSKIYNCKLCDYKSMIVTDLRSHIKNHHVEFFACPECSKAFVAKMYLDSHLLKRHSYKGDTTKSTKTCVSRVGNIIPRQKSRDVGIESR